MLPSKCIDGPPINVFNNDEFILIKYSDEYFFVYEWIYFMLEKLL
jgi:hypothetical protein